MSKSKWRADKWIIKDLRRLIEKDGYFTIQYAMLFCKVGYHRLKRIIKENKMDLSLIHI